MTSFWPPPVYPSNFISLPTKMRPVSPRGIGLPSSSTIFKWVPCGIRPAVPGAARRSAGLAIVAHATSVEP